MINIYANLHQVSLFIASNLTGAWNSKQIYPTSRMVYMYIYIDMNSSYKLTRKF